MKTRKIVHGSEARKKLLEGVDAVANPVKATMGAKGRVVITSYGHITKDGVTVARDVEMFHDPFAAHGAKLVKMASVRACDIAGDGTTATCVLTQSLIRDGFDLIERGKDAQTLKKELEEAKNIVVNALEGQAKKTKNIREIANVSANDLELGAVVSEAVEAVGENGLVTVENTYGETRVEVVSGMQIDKGTVTDHFFTDMLKRKAQYEEAFVLLCDYKLHDVKSLAELLEPLAQKGKPIVVIANDYEEAVLRTLVLSKVKGGVPILAIKSPNIGHAEVMEDIAVYTGATIIKEEDGLEGFSYDWLGFVEKIISTPERTVMQASEERAPMIKKRIKFIKEDAKRFTEQEKRNRESRGARLNGKMAIIHLEHAGTEEKQKEIKDRVEDAIFASQAALERGIVPGGGMAFINASQAITERSDDGSRLLMRALEAPLRQIARNAGKNDGDILAEARGTGKGFNVLTEKFEDLMKTGIVDPLKVSVTSLSNAVDAAGLALITECLSAEWEREDKDLNLPA